MLYVLYVVWLYLPLWRCFFLKSEIRRSVGVVVTRDVQDQHEPNTKRETCETLEHEEIEESIKHQIKQSVNQSVSIIFLNCKSLTLSIIRIVVLEKERCATV
jgi:hypothetical protein